VKGPLARRFLRLTQQERDQGIIQSTARRLKALPKSPSSGIRSYSVYGGGYSAAAASYNAYGRRVTKPEDTEIQKETKDYENGLSVPASKKPPDKPPNKKPPRTNKKNWPSIALCQRCSVQFSRFMCNLSSTGPPCTRCTEDRADCYPAIVGTRPKRYKEFYPNGHDGLFPQCMFKSAFFSTQS
jgi:hypothetical protein